MPNPLDAATTPFSLSVLTVTKGNAAKRLVPDAYGRPTKDPEHSLGISAGRIEHVQLTGLTGLRDLLARILECFDYPPEVRLIMGDYDPEPEATHRLASPQELMDRLAAIWPAFGEVGWLSTISTSSAIRDKQTQEWLRPPEGMHVYVLVTGDVARWRELAKVQLWLAGYGYCKLASPNRHTGVCNILERCLVDLTVFSPERLDYVAGATIAKNAPFWQDRLDPELHPGGVLDLDRLPDITGDERQAYTTLVAEARARIEPEQRRLIREHIARETADVADVEQEIDARLARAERGELDASQPLYFDNGITCTAGTLNKAHDGKRLRDPLEPDYGPSQAVFHWRDGDWRIVSWAHGVKRVYQLVPEASQLPPPDDEDMDDLVARVAGAEEPAYGRKSQATLLVELAADAELWHTPDDDAYATIPIDGHRETWPLRVKAFRRWLARRYFERHGRTPGSQAIQDALGGLEGQALFEGKEHAVYTRLAQHDGRIYLDLANDRWEAIEIDTQGWRLVSDPPVKFRRARGMLPLPCPVSGGTLDDLRTLLNIKDEKAWILIKAWLVQALPPNGPYPVLALHGEQGSAKSTTSRMLRALIDPNKAALRSEPRDERDLLFAASNGWMIGLDNLSHLSPWLSNAICRLATGGGFGTRELYTDDEEKLFDATRPVLLNGIEELATKGDLLDRAIILYLPAIPDDQRKPEAVLWRTFDAKRPLILGALLDAVRHAFAHVDAVQLPRLPRMADFALWAVAAAHDLILEASLITPYVQELAATVYTGTATEILQWLNRVAPEEIRRQKSWPVNGRALLNALRRIAPTFRAVGVDVTFHSGRRKGRRITLERRKNASSSSFLPEENQILMEDASGDANAGGDATSSSSSLRGDAKLPGGDDGGTQAPSPVSAGKIRQEDDGDAEDANIAMNSNHDIYEEGEV